MFRKLASTVRRAVPQKCVPTQQGQALSMSSTEQIVALQCASLLEDGHPQSLYFVRPPTDNCADGLIRCTLCNIDMPQTHLICHLQGPQRWHISAHRRRRHEPHPEQVPDDPNPDTHNYEIIQETHEMGLARWLHTLSLHGLGSFVALESGLEDNQPCRVYCQVCRTVLILPDNVAVMRHARSHVSRPGKWPHGDLVPGLVRPSIDWLAEVLDPPRVQAVVPSAVKGRQAKAIETKLERNLRKRIAPAVSKQFTAQQLFGLPLPRLRAHLESQFTATGTDEKGPCMTWDTYGSWHVDHRVPVTVFNIEDPVHCLVLCHWSNLQPLWGHENLRKGGHMSTHAEPCGEAMEQ